MKQNYNYTRRRLYLPEYGRHIHEMVDQLMQIQDREERNRQARAVIAVMGNLQPLLRDTADFTHKLWDHLFIMSDFQLDVDSPYMQPSRQDLALRPERLRYPQSRIMFKHYGKYAERFVRTINQNGASEASTRGALNIGKYLRAKSYEFNHEHPNNDSIIRDIHLMADNKLEIDLSEISSMRSEYRQGAATRVQRRGKVQQRSNSRHKVQKNSKNNQRHNGHK